MGLRGDTVYLKIKMYSSAICVALLFLKMYPKEKENIKKKKVLLCQNWGSHPGDCRRLNRKSHYKLNPELEFQLTTLTARAFTLFFNLQTGHLDEKSTFARGESCAHVILGLQWNSRVLQPLHIEVCCSVVVIVGSSWALSLWVTVDFCSCGGSCFSLSETHIACSVLVSGAAGKSVAKNSSSQGDLKCESSSCKGAVSVHWSIYCICRPAVFCTILNCCQKVQPEQKLELVLLEEECVLQENWET